MTVAMLALTLSLGVWQIERLQWKRGLLAEIDHGEAVGPVPLSDHPSAFSRVIAEGVFVPGTVRYGVEVRSTPTGPVMGAHVVGVLRRPGALPVVVDQGWAPGDSPITLPEVPARVEGYIRPPETASWSSAHDDPAGHRFFTLDPAAIGAALIARPVAPFTLVALGPAAGYPAPAHALPRPPNDHLSYAITWFSLSAILAIIFVVFASQSLRKTPRP